MPLKISFFHQAHLNNWERYLAALAGEGKAVPWDVVVLTAANARQAQAFEYQLAFRRELGMLPVETSFRVIADPGGTRVGSGGATLNVLSTLAADGTGGNPFCNRRVLILHSGGDSKRLPQYSAFGKIFSPIPRLLASGRPSTLFDELLVALIGIPGAMAPGVVVASGDVLLLFDHGQLDLSRPGFTGVAIRAAQQTASHHGVFVPGRGGKVERFLHKPTPAEMARVGALDGRQTAPVDTGIITFDATVAARLVARGGGDDGWLSRAVAGGVAINFYGEFLLPLAPSAKLDEYLADDSDGRPNQVLRTLRAEIWAELHGTPFYVSVLEPARFLHFGTTREYQQLITYEDDDIRALGGRRRVSHHLGTGAVVAERACLLHSQIGAGAMVEVGANVEFCDLGTGVRIGRDSVVSNVVLPAGEAIPEQVVVHALPLRTAAGARFVVRVWGVDDNPKQTLPNASWLGRPLEEWLDRLGVGPEAIWPAAGGDGDRSLWTARLFPLAASPEQAWSRARQGLSWAADWERGWSANDADAWLATERLSLAESSELADLPAIGNWHRRLFTQLVAAKCMDLFKAEQPVEEWHEKIPTSTDLQSLVEQLRQQAEQQPPSLTSARLHYSIGVLMRGARTGLGREARAMESRAFEQIAELMLTASQGEAVPFRVAKWQQESCQVKLPVRLDFAGGWSDTPPYALERGGTVLNAAIEVDGIRPIHVQLERLTVPEVILESVDLGVRRSFVEQAELLDFSNPHDPLAIHKAALALVVPTLAGAAGLGEALQELGGGLLLRSQVCLPKGTGLGTSSVLATALVKALVQLGTAADFELAAADLFEAAAAVEQMLTTGGGWQDQVGAVVPGFKVVTSSPGCHQHLTIEPLPLPSCVQAELDDRLVLIDTGQRRLAKNLLREIMGAWLRRDRRTVAILGDIQMLAREGAEALRGGDFFELGQILWRHWELNKQLDQGTSNAFIDGLMESLRPHLDGAKLAGAGGGGFLMAIAKPGGREQIRRLLERDFADSNVAWHESVVAW